MHGMMTYFIRRLLNADYKIGEYDSDIVRHIPCYIGWNSTRIFDHPRHVQQVPCHERRVAVGKVVLRSAGTGIEIGWTGPRFAEPIRVSLRRNHVAQMLQ